MSSSYHVPALAILAVLAVIAVPTPAAADPVPELTLKPAEGVEWPDGVEANCAP